MKNKTRVLITGSTGFAGKYLKEYLKNNYFLFTPSHKELDLLDEDSVDRYFKKNKIDVVIHTAVIGGSRKEEAVKSEVSLNLRMFFNILKNKNKFKKMIHCGSGAEYDKRFPIVKVKEEDFGKYIPNDEYGFEKYVCSKYIENTEKIICLRIFALFGPGEDYRYRFISNAICRNIFNMPITMRQNVYFDYIYIKDFLRIVEYFIAHNPKQKFYNIGTGKRIDLKTITDKINSIADCRSKVIIAKKGLNKEYTCNNKRLVSEIKGFKFTPFDTCLKELYTWYKENIQNIDKRIV
jgi:nucleoside-diphosphate-sugar epimerase